MNDKFVDVAVVVAIVTIIVLKCMGVITIKWLWLLAPIWIPFLFGVVLAIFLAVIYLFVNIFNNK